MPGKENKKEWVIKANEAIWLNNRLQPAGLYMRFNPLTRLLTTINGESVELGEYDFAHHQHVPKIITAEKPIPRFMFKGVLRWRRHKVARLVERPNLIDPELYRHIPPTEDKIILTLEELIRLDSKGIYLETYQKNWFFRRGRFIKMVNCPETSEIEIYLKDVNGKPKKPIRFLKNAITNISLNHIPKNRPPRN